MRLHEPDAAPAATSPAVAPTRVLRLRAPVASIGESQAPAGTDTSGSNVPERVRNYRERCIGTAVHMALDELSRREVPPAEPDGRVRERSRAALAGWVSGQGPGGGAGGCGAVSAHHTGRGRTAAGYCQTGITRLAANGR